MSFISLIKLKSIEKIQNKRIFFIKDSKYLLDMNELKNVSLACSYLASLVKDNEVFKRKLQEESILFLELYNLSKGHDRSVTVDSLSSQLDNLLDVVGVGLVDGSVTESNANTFKQGVAKVKQHLAEKLRGGQVNISQFFPRDTQSASREIHTQLTTSVPGAKSLEVVSGRAAAKQNLIEHSEAETVPSNDTDLRSRKAKILSQLSLGACGLKELRVLFSDVNDKTLQRDLLDMIRDKKVVRMGEKRWAKYYLK
jgi:hypothetical protein